MDSMRLAALIILTLLVGIAQAADEQPATISLAFRDADISEALTVISQKGGVTLLGDSSVKGKVNCSLSDVTVDQAVDTVCKINKLEWMKACASPDPEGKLSATELFKLLDAIRELGTSSLVYVDRESQASTIFVPNAKPGSVELSAVTESLKLKPIYLVRAEVGPAAAAKGTQKPQTAVTMQAPPADTRAAADELWGYFSQMPSEQRFEVMYEIGRMLKDNMTPEQREEMMQRKFQGKRQQ